MDFWDRRQVMNLIRLAWRWLCGECGGMGEVYCDGWKTFPNCNGKGEVRR